MVDLSTKVRTNFPQSVARDPIWATSPITPTSSSQDLPGSSKTHRSSDKAKVRAFVPSDEEESKSENVASVKNAHKGSRDRKSVV